MPRAGWALALALVVAGCQGPGPAGPMDAAASDDPPHLVIQYSPQAPRVGQAVDFMLHGADQGSLAADAEATWTIGAESHHGANVRHVFSSQGVFPVQAVVRFGDDSSANASTSIHVAAAAPADPAPANPGPDDGNASQPGDEDAVDPFADKVPYVVVGIPDSGVNPYHEIFRRPDLTDHPCTYVRDFPCDVPALNLTLDATSYEEAVDADRETWTTVEPGDEFWIPGTNIIGALCQRPYSGGNAQSTVTGALDTEPDYCILGDSSSHGTETASSVLTENPDALLIVEEGNAIHDSLTNGRFPVDVISFSWGAPVPLYGGPVLTSEYSMFFVAASGNEGAFPVVADSSKGHQSVITVGAADGSEVSEPGYSGWKTMEFVSEYCRPLAVSDALAGTENGCGTSFAAPTFAGALSAVILEVRRESGYVGGIVNGSVDPLQGHSMWDVRDAVNRSATYDPDDAFDGEDPEDGGLFVPAVTAYQYGWGYVARNQIRPAVECVLRDVCGSPDPLTATYMQALWAIRSTYDLP